jgi:hypothetical protein
MSVTLTVNGTPYSFPSQGTNPAWGENIVDWAEAVTDVLSTLSSATDILNSSFTILDNQSSEQSVVGLSFDISLVRGAIIEYSLYRSGSTPKDEKGTMWISYDGTDWELSREANNDVGVVFTITNAGQVKYTSSNTSASGVMKFRARTTAQ